MSGPWEQYQTQPSQPQPVSQPEQGPWTQYAKSQPEQAQPQDVQKDPGFLSNLATSAGNAVKGIGSAIAHPVDTLMNIGGLASASPLDIATGGANNPAVRQLGEHLIDRYGGLDKVKSTAYKDPVGFALDALSVLGPIAEASGLDLSSLIPNKRVPVAPKLGKNLDNAESSAVQFGDKNGIPLDTATRTGNTVARNAQRILQDSPGVSGFAKNARKAQASAMENTGESIIKSLGNVGTAKTPELSGQGIRDALEAKIKKLGSDANNAYQKVREAEALPENSKPVVVGHNENHSGLLDANGNQIRSTSEVTRNVALPVDSEPIRQSVKPALDRMESLMPEAQRQGSRALNVMRGIMNGERYQPLSSMEENLGALKAAQREAPNANTSRLIGNAIKAMQDQVDQTASSYGLSDSLENGRAITKQKYDTIAVLDKLKTEPVQLFNQITTSKDLGIDLLRDVDKHAPEALPEVGKSYMQGLMDKAFGEAGTAKPGTALTEWNKLGPETKKLLFKDPGTIKDIGDYFTLAKRVAENPNPSGTAVVGQLMFDGSLAIHSPHLAVPYIVGKAALGRILLSPGGAKALTTGLTVPLRGAAGSSAVAANIIRLANSVGQQDDQSR